MEHWNQQATSTSSQSQMHQMGVVQKDEVQYVMRQITDNVRFALLEAISVRSLLWDTSNREKITTATRRSLFAEVTDLLNQQFVLNPAICIEEVEKNWKNLKDTYVKCRKKLAYDHEGCMIRPKWKFFDAMMFLDVQLSSPSDFGLRKRMSPYPQTHHHNHSLPQQQQAPPPPPQQQYDLYGGPTPPPAKKEKIDEPPTDEFMEFCRSLYLPLKEIGYKDRVHWLKVQKTIRDVVFDAQMEVVSKAEPDVS